jgi:hypothetical protein
MKIITISRNQLKLFNVGLFLMFVKECDIFIIKFNLLELSPKLKEFSQIIKIIKYKNKFK